MAGLSATFRKLAAYRKRFEKLTGAAKPKRTAKTKRAVGRAVSPTQPRAVKRRLTVTFDFGTNPGNLRMLSFVSVGLKPSAPLVVILHGCTQSAAEYDVGTGWSELAARHGFAVLYPEQKRTNNGHLCFNWFLPDDTTRDSGEVASIRQMIAKMVDGHGLDPKRVSITGLSAGGAMTSAMLACYPETFSHGAVIAGLPYRAATNAQGALGAMFHGASKSPQEWAAVVTEASSHVGPWPKISIWHGTGDRTVRPSNARESVSQWTAVHGLPPTPSREDKVGGFPHRIWKNAGGAIVVESYEITDMGHGTPIAFGKGASKARFGKPGKYSLDVGISSSLLLAKRWGLVGPETSVKSAKPSSPQQPTPVANRSRKGKQAGIAARRTGSAKAAAPTGLFTTTMRAMGLLK